MAASQYVNDPAAVSAFIQKMEPAFAQLAEAVRQLIVNTSTDIGQQIKWNAPAFFYTGEMKPFDPKTYKRDIVVFNMRKGAVLLIFPTGAVINDTTGILEGNYADGRRMVTFKDMDDVVTKGKDLQTVIAQWLAMVE